MNSLLDRKIPLDTIIVSPNVAADWPRDDCQKVALHAAEGYNADVSTRAEWEKRQAQANKLALQVFEHKTDPWPGASSVKFPLITNAAMQYHAKAYSALVSGTELVKCRTYGEDPGSEKLERAKRCSAHMSWQNLREDKGWEEGQDKLFLIQAIAGTVFKKRVFDSGRRRQVSRLVLPEDFVIAYNSTSIAEAQRYTHRFNLSHNDVRQREMDGRFREPDAEIAPALADANEISDARERREGVVAGPVDHVTPFQTAEQACWIDFDGDGYQEPYLVTFDIASGVLRRVVARFVSSGIKDKRGNIYKSGGSVYEIEPVPMFIKYPFIPSPDGGFYDLGLGTLLGPINESINTSINQLHDAATMHNLGGGFVGRGFKSKGGPITFRPNQWHPVDSSGDDLRKNILPLPVREPSPVLFQLLGLLLQYAERIVSATDLQVGENIGQNTPAETARTMNANGARVYNGIYKRTWRAEREDYNVQYHLNYLFFENDLRFTDLTTGKTAMVRADDYRGSDIDISPEADPHIVSDEEGVRQATALVQLAMATPGYNKYQAHRRLLKAMKVAGIEEVLPPPMQQGPDGKPQPANDFPPLPNAKLMDAQTKMGHLELDKQQAQFENMAVKFSLQSEIAVAQAKVHQLEAQSVKLLAEAKGAEAEPMIKLIYAQIESESKHKDVLMKVLEMMGKQAEKSNGAADGAKPAMAEGQPGGQAALGGVSHGNGAAVPA